MIILNTNIGGAAVDLRMIIRYTTIGGEAMSLRMVVRYTNIGEVYPPTAAEIIHRQRQKEATANSVIQH